MKILLVTNSFNLGGAETHILELALLLKRDGHDVSVASSGGIYELELRRNKIPHYTFPLDQKKMVNIIESYYGLKKLIENEKFDIVHAHARIPAFICEMINKKVDFKFVTTCHGTYKNNELTKKYSYWGEHVFSVSENVDNYLIQTYNIQKSGITRVINGVNTHRFVKKAPYKELVQKYSLEGKKVIYTTTRLDNEACTFVDEVLKSVVSLAYTYPNIVYMVSGSGNRLEYYKNVANEINERFGETKVIFTGPIYNVNDYLNLAYMFIGPSRSALEALSSGVITVVSGSLGHIGIFSEDTKELCIETNFCGKRNYTADDKTYYELIEGILNLDSKEYKKMSEYGSSFINANYSLDIMYSQYKSYYDELLERHKNSDYVLCGYFGNNNYGDDLMLESFISEIRKYDKTKQFTCISSQVKSTRASYGVKSVFKYNLKNIKKSLNSSSALIFPGGNIFQDKSSFRSLKYYSYIAKLAKKLNNKVYILGNGIGPLKRKRSEEITKSLLYECDYISLRDIHSFEFVKDLNKETYLTSDITSRYIDKEKPILDNMKYFVFSPKEEKHKKSTSYVEMIKKIKELYNIECVIVPLHNKQDMKISRMVAKETSSILFESYDTHSMENIISNAMFVISMRLHGCVESANSCVPFISLSYDDKLKFFNDETYKKLSIETNDVYELVEYFTKNSEQIKEKLKDALDERIKLKNEDFARIIGKMDE